MLILPWPESAWALGVLIVLAGPAIGILYTPAMAMLSDGAEEVGIAQGFAFALVEPRVGDRARRWARPAARRLADALGDRVPYLILAGGAAATLAVLVRQLARERRRAR